ncbi:MAG: molybdenum cofactor biosynthesis protein MoaE [bacterium]|nr:molybdenum cofactor biosynthesis protein MoaE [bacterium]
MTVTVEFIEGPIISPPCHAIPSGAGGVVIFEGRVRALEDGRPITALRYEAYPPMTDREMRRAAESAASRHGLLALHIEHSTGRVGIDECSFRAMAAAPHRKEAFAALQEFIDEMKQSVPLWKIPVWE